MRRIKISYMASAHRRAMPHKPKKYKMPVHRKCRECFRRTVHDCPNERAAYFADILQRFCKMSKVRRATWCNHTGRGPNERHSAVRRRFLQVCGGSAVRRRFRVFAARAQRAVVFVCLRRECSAHALFASLRRERSAQVFSHLRAYLPPFVNGVPGNTGSLK